MELDVTPLALSSLLGSMRARTVELLEQVDPVDFHRPLRPSGWTVLELVTHLTRDDEHYWFADLVAGAGAGRPVGGAAPGRSDHPGPIPVTKAEACRQYLRAIEVSESVVEGRDLDEPTAWLDPAVPPRHQPRSIGDVLTLAVLEYGIHVGHLEAAVEVFSARAPGPHGHPRDDLGAF